MTWCLIVCSHVHSGTVCHRDPQTYITQAQCQTVGNAFVITARKASPYVGPNAARYTCVSL